MGLYKRKDSPFWWMSFRIKGRRIFESTGTANRKLAQRIHAKRLTEIIEGRWFCNNEDCKHRTFKELTDKYSAEYLPRLKRRDRSEIAITHLLDFFGEDTHIEAIGDAIGGYEAHRRNVYKTIAPATIVKELGVLRRMYNIAMKKWRWVKENPVDRIELPKVDNERVRYLKPDELKKLKKALPEWLWPIVTLARHTGLRRGNLLELTWDNVNFKARTLHVPRTKNGMPIGIPLTDTALKVLEEQYRVRYISSHYVFCDDHGRPFKPCNVSKTFERTCKKAGIAHMRFHDLRHDFASSLVQSGIDLNLVRELLGHRDTRMTLRYAHLAPENLRKAVKVLDAVDRLRFGYVEKKGLTENQPTP